MKYINMRETERTKRKEKERAREREREREKEREIDRYNTGIERFLKVRRVHICDCFRFVGLCWVPNLAFSQRQIPGSADNINRIR